MWAGTVRHRGVNDAVEEGPMSSRNAWSEDKLVEMVSNVVALPDPEQRYLELTKLQRVIEEFQSALVRARGAALKELKDKRGLSSREVAELVGLGTRQRVDQIINAARVGQQQKKE